MVVLSQLNLVGFELGNLYITSTKNKYVQHYQSGCKEIKTLYFCVRLKFTLLSIFFVTPLLVKNMYRFLISDMEGTHGDNVVNSNFH